MTSIDYDRLFATHREHLWGLCYRVTGSAADADDLVQDTFRRAIESPPPDRSRPWRPWLATVATRLSIDALRRRKARRYVGPWLPSPLETPPGDERGQLASSQADMETRYGLRESVSFAFLRALEALNPVQRATLVLRDVLGYSGPETAQVLEVSADNVRVILHRARQALSRYDEERQPPSSSVDARHQAALQRFMMALSSGDAARIAECLAQEVRVSTDGGGRYRASTKPVVGRDRVASFFVGLLLHGGPPVAADFRLISGRPGIVSRQPVNHPRDAPRACMTFDLDANDQIVDIHVVSMPDKLGALSFPG
ncbi:MAG: sigma-70 family RNA polymerase sigma factor [Myxococcota bacterium]